MIAIDRLHETKGVQFFDSEIVRNTLSDYIHSNVEFSDCLLNRINNGRGLTTYTFDNNASKLKGMKKLK